MIDITLAISDALCEKIEAASDENTTFEEVAERILENYNFSAGVEKSGNINVLNLEISNELYEKLLDASDDANTTLKEVAVNILKSHFKPADKTDAEKADEVYKKFEALATLTGTTVEEIMDNFLQGVQEVLVYKYPHIFKKNVLNGIDTKNLGF